MWTLIISLLVVGLALLVIEIVFVPGTTLVGIIGVIFAGSGVLITFREYGNETGVYMLAGSSAIAAAALYLSFRSNAWKRFSNNSAIRSRVNEGMTSTLRLGDEGVAVSTLKPIGKAQFGRAQFEVRTLGDYVDVGTSVKIVHIESNQIIVKPLN